MNKTTHCIHHVRGYVVPYTNMWLHLSQIHIPGAEVIKHFSCSTQLSMKFIILINVRMSSIVSILTLISQINTSSESFKARNAIIFPHLVIILKLRAQLD